VENRRKKVVVESRGSKGEERRVDLRVPVTRFEFRELESRRYVQHIFGPRIIE